VTRSRNPDARHPYSYATLIQRLHAWVADLELRDANGQPARTQRLPDRRRWALTDHWQQDH
jgi:hypothetical protein